MFSDHKKIRNLVPPKLITMKSSPALKQRYVHKVSKSLPVNEVWSAKESYLHYKGKWEIIIFTEHQ